MTDDIYSKRRLALIILILTALALIPLIAYATRESTERAIEPQAIATTTVETVATSTPELTPEIEKTSGESDLSNVGIASWYNYSLDGAPNYSRENATAASRDYPRGSRLKVTNVSTGASVIVRVNDYGPEAWTGRAIDLSSYAFSQIAPLGMGLADVRVEQVIE